MKPILFSTPMVQAILKEQKTQTRRVVKGPYAIGLLEMGQPNNALTLCRRRPGDILWVRETFRPKSHGMPIGDRFEYRATALEDGNPTDEPWKPSIFMPKEACRIFLAVTNVWVEQLQSISEADAKAEGFDSVDSFFALWQKINGTESLASNPWVWVYEFKLTSPKGA